MRQSRRGQDSSVSGWDPRVGCSKHANEMFGSINGKGLFISLTTSRFLRMIFLYEVIYGVGY
jgi:hypothetical protein